MTSIADLLDAARGHYRAGRHRDAEEACREILARDPAHAHAHHLLGSLYLETGEHAMAAEAIAEALRLAGPHAEMLLNAGEALRRLGRESEAVEHFARALELEPGMYEAHTGLALALLGAGRTEAAIEHAASALESSPRPASVLVVRGLAERAAGRLDESIESFRRALDLDPTSLDAAAQLAAAGLLEEPSILEALEAALERRDLTSEQHASLHFTLGKAYDDAGDHDHAFEHYRQGNCARRTAVPYDRGLQGEFVERFLAYFDESFADRTTGWGHESAHPVFVIGMPRSGTTLVERIVAGHPRAAAAGELPLLGALVNEVPRAIGSPVGLPECFDHFTADHAHRLAGRYLDGLRAHDRNALRITDKHTINFRLVPLIRALFPHARIVRVERGALDTCLSCYFQSFREGQAFSYDLDDAAHYYGLYRRMTEHWRDALGIEMLRVRYEELVADPEPVARALIEWCGLDWDPACLRPHEGATPVRTASVWQLREPIHTRSVERWRHHARHLHGLRVALAARGIET